MVNDRSPWLLARFLAVWQTSAVAFGVTAPLGFALAQPLAIHPLEMAWNPVQALRLSAVYLLLMVPFFCAANCIGLAFARFGERVGRIYRYDLTADDVAECRLAVAEPDWLRSDGGRWTRGLHADRAPARPLSMKYANSPASFAAIAARAPSS